MSTRRLTRASAQVLRDEHDNHDIPPMDEEGEVNPQVLTHLS